MTIGEGLIQWLYGFGDIEAEDLIQTDRLDGTVGSYGLYRQPTREETVFIDGSRDVSCYYLLLARRAVKADVSRIGNQAWMESLEDWVSQRNRLGDLPHLGARRTCNSVGISITAYMAEEQETGTAAYQLTVRINYTEV